MDELGQITPPDWCRSPGKMSQCLERHRPHGPTPHGVLQALIAVPSDSQHCFHPLKRHLPLARTSPPTATLCDCLERSELSTTRVEMCCSRTEPAALSSTGSILTAALLKGKVPEQTVSHLATSYTSVGVAWRQAERKSSSTTCSGGWVRLLVNRAGRL